MVQQYLPFAYDAGANVVDPADWPTDPDRADGFVAGVARSAAVNTALRQASVGVAGLSAAIVQQLGGDMLDDGNVNSFRDRVLALMTSVAAAAIDAAGSFGWGGIYGLTIVNTPGFTTTRITAQVGQCRDSTNTANITLNAPLTKRLDVAWAAGEAGGGRDAGVLANGQTWHVFLIRKDADGSIDMLFSQSPTAPTLPGGYSKFRRIGSILLEAASTNIRQFIQVGDFFMLKTRSADYASQPNNGGVPYLRVVTVPAGIKVEAIFYFQSTGTANDTNAYLSGIYDPDFGVPAAFGGATQWAQIRRISTYIYPGSWNSYGTVITRQFTDTNKQVYTFSSDSGASPGDTIALGVLGWRDDRGRFL